MRQLVGSFSVLIYFVNTVFWFIPIFGLSFLKLLPVKPWQTLISYILDGCASNWISVNNLNQTLLSNIRWDVQGIDKLNPKEWYLVIANHRSWVDILVLQRVFNRKIPFLKFFLKKELIWVPFLGLAWWALDFPFMRRYSRKFLEKHPEMKGKDLEATKEACRKFKFKPVSVMNFVEGTRITPKKHQKQQSEFTHLLKPKAGGMAFVLEAMQKNLNVLLDVTIYYPGGTPNYWDFVCGKVKHIQVRVETLSIPALRQQGVIASNYFDDASQRAAFQSWLNQRWQHKDQQLQALKNGY
ncbi:acyltransferase [Planctobacterium marinum]|uniref:acyltransferase n=1 Tax=Planctobacterium marinum TaxID=1631968 RepID=UPI001E2E9D90|nr:acyltransferase [Planctobacterium marinum]MCC2607961.1 acyltransferase [Planctobacterium marinum]